jgi:hypothetical protein
MFTEKNLSKLTRVQKISYSFTIEENSCTQTSVLLYNVYKLKQHIKIPRIQPMKLN